LAAEAWTKAGLETETEIETETKIEIEIGDGYSDGDRILVPGEWVSGFVAFELRWAGSSARGGAAQGKSWNWSLRKRGKVTENLTRPKRG